MDRCGNLPDVEEIALPLPAMTRSRLRAQLPALKAAILKEIGLCENSQAAPLKAAENGIVARAEVDEWLAEQELLNASGDFFQMWFFVMVNGTV